MLTIAQAAVSLGLSKRTVRRLIHSGDLAHNRMRGAIRVPQEAVDDYKRRTFWPSRNCPTGVAPSSSNRADFVFSDGSRPARRKPRATSSSSDSGAN
jgi:excisionase family DNA binding protein